MPDYAVNIVLRGVDEATPIIRRVISESKKLRSVRARGGAVGAVLDPDGGGRLRPGPSGDRDRFKTFAQGAGTVADRLDAAGSSMQRFGAAGRAAIGAPLELAANYEAAENRVNALSGGVFGRDGQLAQLSERARALGASTEFSATQVMEAFAELTQGGLTAAQQLDTINTVLDVSTVAQIGMAEAAHLTSVTLAQFGLDADQAGRVGDVLVRASNASQMSITELGNSFKYAAPVAKAFGSSVEETATAVGVLSNAGMGGSMAGTSLRSFINRLAGASNEEMRTDSQARAMKILHMDSAGLKKAVDSKSIQELGDFMNKSVQDAIAAGVSSGDIISAMQKLFQEKAGTGAMVLAESFTKGAGDPKSWVAMSTAVNDATVSLESSAALIRSGMKGAIEELKSQLEELGLTVGKKLAPMFGPLVKDLTTTVGEMAKWAEANPGVVTGLGKLALGMAAMGTVLSPVLFGLSSVVRLVGVGIPLIKGLGLATGYTGLAVVKFGQAIHTVGPKVTSMIGSTTGKLGILGMAAAAGIAGYEFGRWADETFKISDALAGLNHATQTQIDLQQGLAHVRGATLLGDLTEEERTEYQGAKEKRDALFEELDKSRKFEIERAHLGWFASDEAQAARPMEDVEADIAAQDRVIDRLNVTGINRGKKARGEAMPEAFGSSFTGAADPAIERLERLYAQQITAAEAQLAVAKGKNTVVLEVNDKRIKVSQIASEAFDLLVQQGIVKAG